MRDRVGKVRRSQVVTTYGPGAIIDFRAPGTGAPLSGVLAGLEEWDEAAGMAGRRGINHPQSIQEPRLEKRLKVRGFRQPPVRPKKEGKEDDNDFDVLPVVRFPQWLQCPRCSRLRRADEWMKTPGKPERICGGCTEANDDNVYVVPVRFIVACEDGHLDEFPWQRWIGCTCRQPQLKLEMSGPGLAGKLVLCLNKACTGTRTSLEKAFERVALTSLGLKCLGQEPWLATRSTPCKKLPRVLQRGASNVYYGNLVSSLDIPPFSADLSDEFGRAWTYFENKPPEQWAMTIDVLELDKRTGKPKEVLLAALQEWKVAMESDSSAPIQWAEYLQFRKSGNERVSQGEFQTVPEPPPPELTPYVESVVLATRLREVRAEDGFTRINPPGGIFRDATQKFARLSIKRLDWLPAVSMRGEGIFLRFNTGSLEEWEQQPSVVARMAAFNQRLRDSLRKDEKLDEDISPRLVLIHSFAHALMRRLSLECGYSSSALKERLYVPRGGYDMAGVLIHTGSPDSEGTLGGLVRQGRSNRLVETLFGALRDNAWCSSDPVCITGTATLSSPRNGAACHACLLVPETSCEQFNVLLDRALLVGTAAEPETGYFRPLIEEQLF